MKPGGRFAVIRNLTDNREFEELNGKDFVVVVGWFNDFYYNETSKTTIESVSIILTHTNVLVLDISSQHDPMIKFSINGKIERINFQIYTHFKNVKMFSVSDFQSFHTFISLHLKATGIEFVASKLCEKYRKHSIQVN